MNRKLVFLNAFALLVLCVNLGAAPNETFHTEIMQSTVRIIGPAASGHSVGTGFFMVHVPEGKTNGPALLITANHVLSEIQGEIAQIEMRQNANGQWTSSLVPIRIRRGTNAMWTQEPNGADVAVIKPENIPNFRSYYPDGLPSTQQLATEDSFSDYNILTGMEVFSIGFPFGSPSTSGFPIAKSGIVSSYPVSPTREIKSFLCDLRGWPGNSGGPVYIAILDPIVKGNHMIGGPPANFVIGVLTQSYDVNFKNENPFLSMSLRMATGLNTVVPSTLILDTIQRLPP